MWAITAIRIIAPVRLISRALWEMTDATVSVMQIMEKTGRKLVIFSQAFSKNLLSVRPSAMGIMTTFMMEKNMAQTSTCTVVFRSI